MTYLIWRNHDSEPEFVTRKPRHRDFWWWIEVEIIND